MEVKGKYNGVWNQVLLIGNGDIKTGVDHLKSRYNSFTHAYIWP